MPFLLFSFRDYAFPTILFNFRDYALRGAYRKMIVKPENLTWSCQMYDDPTIPLVLGDLDILNGVSLQEPPNGNYANH